MSITIGNTTIHLEPFIYLLNFLIIFTLLYVAFWRIKAIGFKKSFTSGDYKSAIKSGNSLLNYYKRSPIKTSNIKGWIEALNLTLAVSYFAEKNDELFLKHINIFNQNADTKNFWLALYYLKKENISEAQKYFDCIAPSDNTRVITEYYSAMLLSKQGENEEARERMKAVYPELNHKILKQMAEEIINK